MGTREPKFGHPPDGFFAALVAGPETVMLSKDYPEVFGSDFRASTKPTIIAGMLFKGVLRAAAAAERERHGARQQLGLTASSVSGTCATMAELVNDEEHGGC
jgi:hypothetical protein